VRDPFQRIHGDGKQIVLATSGKKSETKYYINLLNVGDLIEAKIASPARLQPADG
jgi:hypothetical protein